MIKLMVPKLIPKTKIVIFSGTGSKTRAYGHMNTNVE